MNNIIQPKIIERNMRVVCLSVCVCVCVLTIEERFFMLKVIQELCVCVCPFFSFYFLFTVFFFI